MLQVSLETASVETGENDIDRNLYGRVVDTSRFSFPPELAESVHRKSFAVDDGGRRSECVHVEQPGARAECTKEAKSGRSRLISNTITATSTGGRGVPDQH
jgi:hypothetical protein